MSTIGLNIKLLQLQPHSKLWRAEYEKEGSRLVKVLGNLAMDIQHIGSTAIPNMIAKPVIDIAVGVKSIHNFHACIKLMKQAGYVYIESKSNKRTLLLFGKRVGLASTHYVHVSKHLGKNWRKEVFFRDYLISHPREAKRYSELKLRLAKKYTSNRG